MTGGISVQGDSASFLLRTASENTALTTRCAEQIRLADRPLRLPGFRQAEADGPAIDPESHAAETRVKQGPLTLIPVDRPKGDGEASCAELVRGCVAGPLPHGRDRGRPRPRRRDRAARSAPADRHRHDHRRARLCDAVSERTGRARAPGDPGRRAATGTAPSCPGTLSLTPELLAGGRPPVRGVGAPRRA